MLFIFSVTFASLIFAAVTTAADNDNGVTFLYPPAGLTFNYLDTINVSYNSPFAKPILIASCLKYTGGPVLEKDRQYGYPYNASALVLIKWTEYVSCYFTLLPSKNNGNGSRDTNSPWFRINSEARPTPVTLGLNQNSTTTATPAPTLTDTPSTSHKGLSSGAKIGIGVGVALGVFFVLAAGAVIIIMRRRKRSNMQASTQLLQSDTRSSKSDLGARDEGHFVPMKPVPMEMQAKEAATEQPHELSSDTAFEMDTESRIAELNADGSMRPGSR